jgi:AraC family transcriptional regulator of adaptative response/methylated-DNA-[protein]-cysteine methyltransferase
MMQTIDWSTTPIIDGLALVATSSEGLCAVRLGQDTPELVAELQNLFPEATLVQKETVLLKMVADLVADLVAGIPHPGVIKLVLDAQGTVFQQEVWQALRNIPAGETRSYQQIAQSLGLPRAMQAVGQACAQNPLPIIIPCHRVVGSDGSLHGYLYGPARKQQLLDAEARSLGKPGYKPIEHKIEKH